MIKLNGSAIISSNAQNNPLYLCELQNADQVQNNLIELLRAFYFLVHRIDEYKIELYFSWENPSFLQQSNLREFLKPIEVLVIIGYSFPFFNRKSDSKIFQYLQNLKKIYIQNPRAAEVLDEINQIYTPGAHGVNVELRTSHTQFLFPKELEV